MIWFTCKYYKPAFTNVIFSDEGIISKTHFEQEKLPIDTIKGSEGKPAEPGLQKRPAAAELRQAV